LAPDWICEVLSPSTAKVDRLQKMSLYARAGVSHLWLIDPDLRTLEVCAPQTDGHWLLLTTQGNDAQVSQPPFDSISFDLSVLWPDE
jgi:Uma2 family endonuclease